MEFDKNVPIPPNYIITGPLYAQSVNDIDVDPAIKAVFQKNNGHQVNIFCSMGSSAKKEFLIEAVQAIASLRENNFHAVILVPNAICSITEILPLVKNHSNIFVTDQFVPATHVNAMADITLCHGGQGTIQTAMTCGSPIIGFAMQPEQQINLDHIVSWGAGIRIPITRWNRKNIILAIKRLLFDHSYKENSVLLGKIMAQANGKSDTAQVIWKFMKDH